MENLIHQYLDENYFPYKQENDHYRIYHNDMIIDVLYEEAPVKLNQNLINIYGIKQDEVRSFVNSWAIKYFPDIDLTKYWGRFVELDRYTEKWKSWAEEFNGREIDDYQPEGGRLEGVVFPIVQRVMAKTIAQDLVSVQPLATPKMNLFYFIPHVKKPTFKEKLNSMLRKVKIFIRKMEKDIRKYLHITNYNTTFVTQLE